MLLDSSNKMESTRKTSTFQDIEYCRLKTAIVSELQIKIILKNRDDEIEAEETVYKEKVDYQCERKLNCFPTNMNFRKQ